MGAQPSSFAAISDAANSSARACLDELIKAAKAHELKLDMSVEARMDVGIRKLKADFESLKSAPINYSLTRVEGGDQTIGLILERSGENSYASVQIEVAEAETADLFNYDVMLAKSNGQSETKLTQTFHVNQGCESRLGDTDVALISKAADQVSVAHVVLHPGTNSGSLQKSEDIYKIPQGAIYLDLSKLDNAKTFKSLIDSSNGKNYYSVEPEIGLLDVSIRSTESNERFDPLITSLTKFENFEIEFSSEGERLAATQVAFSTSSKFVSTTFQNQETWEVSEGFWISQNLEVENDLSSQVVIDSGVAAKLGNSLVRLESNQEYSFLNLSPYWLKQPATSDSESDWSFSANLRSVRPQLDNTINTPLVLKEKRAGNPALVASPLVQVDAPEVQLLAQRLKPFLNESRVRVAFEIAKIVNSHIAYDYDSLKSGQIYALSTLDVLDRKKGVCQHFANLFAALGRAVGLPTRIVIGYHVSESGAGAHAWNEIEIEDGKWVPIEPQSEKLLITEGAYMPFAVSTMLETGKVSGQELQALGFVRFKYTLMDKLN